MALQQHRQPSVVYIILIMLMQVILEITEPVFSIQVRKYLRKCIKKM
jgi:hypothetical protein